MLNELLSALKSAAYYLSAAILIRAGVKGEVEESFVLFACGAALFWVAGYVVRASHEYGGADHE